MKIEIEVGIGSALTILMGAAVLAVGGIVLTTDLSPLRPPASIEKECSINGLGNGSCTFHNAGGKKGAICFVAAVVKRAGTDAGSTRVCSGNLEPEGVSQMTFFVSGMDGCKDSVLGWQSACSLILR